MSENWSGSYAYRAREIVAPESVAELAEVVVGTDGPLHALGSRHSFNDVADAPGGTLVSLAHLPREVAVDSATRTVRVSAGLRYGDVVAELDRAGWALANLASLPHISIAGAVATATHGSGAGNRNLSAAVAGLTLIDGAGRLVELRRGDDGFDGAVVALGALGIVVALDLDLVPSFEVRQTVATGLPWDAVPEALESAYSVSVFTTWDEPAARLLWVKATDGGEPELFGAEASVVPQHPVPGEDPAACTEQLGAPGPWHERLPHFRLEFTPSAGDEIQSEYLVPRGATTAAVEVLRALGSELAPALHISEVRAVAPDGLWLSTAYSSGTDAWADGATAFHFTWKKQPEVVSRLVVRVEEALAPFGARPHWGKVLADASRVPALYPRWADFGALRKRFDSRRFENDFVRRLFAARA